MLRTGHSDDCHGSQTKTAAEKVPEGAELEELAKNTGQKDVFLLIIFSLLESVATVLVIIDQAPAAPCIVEHDEDSLTLPATQSAESPVPPVLPNGSVVSTKLSKVEIKVCTAKKRSKTLQARS